VAWAAAVTVALPANAEGLFAVADGAPGKATAQCRPAPAIAADCFAFFRAPGGMPSGSKPLRGEFRLRGGTVADALVGSTKLGEGSKPTSLTATLAEGRLHVEIGLTVRGGAATCAVDASVLGDRFFGTYVTTAGEQTWRGRVAGYLEAVDAPTTNWGESDARKDLAALKAK
jgi:hypothetical protein